MQPFSGASRFLPSPRVGALSVIVAAMIVAVVIFRADGAPQQENGAVVARLSGEPQTITEHDSDGDGVKDWEEKLWGLSSVSQDTDGDGVGDAQEIKEEQARRQEQKLGFLSEAAAVSGNVSYEGLTETEKLSRGILEQVVAFQSAGISLDSQATNDVASVLGSIVQAPVAAAAVNLSDIATVPETPASLAAYANALGTILGGEATTETNELLVLAKFGETGDVAALSALTSVVATYDEIIDALTNTPAPAPLARAHAELINAFARVRASIALLSQLQGDPIKGLQGLQAYTAHSASVASSFATLREYLRARVTLPESAPGFIIIDEKAR